MTRRNASAPAPANPRIFYCRVPMGLPAVLQAAGFDPAPLRETVISVDRYFAYWTSLEARAGDALVGARLGIRYCDYILEPTHLAFVASAKLEEALPRLQRHLPILLPLTVAAVREGGWLKLHCEWHCAERPPHCLVDAHAAFILALIRKATLQAIPARIALTRARTRAAEWTELMNATIGFGAERGEVSIPEPSSGLEFATHSPALTLLLDSLLDEEARRSAHEDSLAHIRAWLLANLSRRISRSTKSRVRCSSFTGYSPFSRLALRDARLGTTGTELTGSCTKARYL